MAGATRAGRHRRQRGRGRGGGATATIRPSTRSAVRPSPRRRDPDTLASPAPAVRPPPPPRRRDGRRPDTATPRRRRRGDGHGEDRDAAATAGRDVGPGGGPRLPSAARARVAAVTAFLKQAATLHNERALPDRAGGTPDRRGRREGGAARQRTARRSASACSVQEGTPWPRRRARAQLRRGGGSVARPRRRAERLPERILVTLGSRSHVSTHTTCGLAPSAPHPTPHRLANIRHRLRSPRPRARPRLCALQGCLKCA